MLALGQGSREMKPSLMVTSTLREARGARREKEGCLPSAAVRGQQHIGEEGVARRIAILRAGAFGAVGGKPTQSDVAEDAVVRREMKCTSILLCRMFVGIVASDDASAPGTLAPSRDIAMCERAGGDEPFGSADRQSLSNAEPSGSRTRQRPRAAYSDGARDGRWQVRPLRRSRHSCRRFLQELHSDHHVVAIGAQGIGRATPFSGRSKKKRSRSASDRALSRRGTGTRRSGQSSDDVPRKREPPTPVSSSTPVGPPQTPSRAPASTSVRRRYVNLARSSMKSVWRCRLSR